MMILEFFLNHPDGRILGYALICLALTGLACLVERHYNIDYYEEENEEVKR